MSRLGIGWLIVASSTLVVSTLVSDVPRSTGTLPTADWLTQTWETEDGLPEDSATAMVQTADGYLWFGTFRGLARFDGVKFTVFDRGNTPELPSDSIINLHLDKRGRLWVSTDAGLVIKEGPQWRRFGKEDGWGTDYVRTFAERNNGDILLTTFNGDVFEFTRGRFTKLPSPPGEPKMGYLGTVDETQQWWVLQHGFIGTWDGHKWVQGVSVPSSVGSSQVGCASARGGGIWLLLGQELRKYQGGAEVTRINLPEVINGLWSMMEDSRGNVWISTYNRGLRQVTPTGELRSWTTTNGLSSQSMRFVFEDRERNLWAGTSGGGLMRFRMRRCRSFGPESGLTERVVPSVSLGSDGELFIGTYGGDGVYRFGQSGIRPIPLSDIPGANKYVHSILAGRGNRLWIGTYGHGLWLADQQGTRNLPNEQTGANIVSLFEDSRGRLWMQGGNSAVALEPQTLTFTRFGKEQGIPDSGSFCFAEDGSGAIWLSSLDAVFRMQNQRFVEVRAGDGKSIAGILCIKADPDGTIWMGSQNRGLLRWRDQRLARIDQKAGLRVNMVQAILEDDEGAFWMTSHQGLMRARRKDLAAVADGTASTLSCQLLDTRDGLPGVEFARGRQPTCAKGADGRLWFGTAKGLAMVDPKEFGLNTVPAEAHIEGFVYHAPGEERRSQQRAGAAVDVTLAPPFPGPLRLPAGSQHIEIHYAAPSFSAPEKVRFQTRLEPNGDWINVEGSRVAHFHERSPGDYVFRVRAANNDGVWDETGTSIGFTVLPFFWQTGWFRTATGGAVVVEAALIVGLLMQRSRRQRAQLQLTESEARFRTMADTAPMMIWVAGVDKLCTFLNQSWLSFTGRALEQELGNGWAEGVHPEDRQRCLDIYSAAFEERVPFTMEYRLRRKDGEYRWILDRGSARFGSDGSFLGYVGCCIDLTERRKAEADLRTSQERMELAAEAAHLGMWVWDVSTNVMWASEKCHELFALPKNGQLTYQAFLQRVHPGDRLEAERATRLAIARKAPYRAEYRLLLPDQTQRWVSASGRVDFDSAGNPLRMLGICIDISEQRRAEEAARELSGRLIHAQEDERRRIARDLHDDLNQQLALLSVEMELLGRELPLSGTSQHLEHVVARVKGLSADVHKLSYHLHPAKLDQLGLVSAARGFCRELTQQSGIRIEFDHKSVPRDVPADVALCLYRIIQESLQNMVRHSGAREAAVQLHGAGDHLKLLITDSGKGFDLEVARRTGGLGLISMEERVRLVHGSIAIRSRPGDGTRVDISVPLPPAGQPTDAT